MRATKTLCLMIGGRGRDVKPRDKPGRNEPSGYDSYNDSVRADIVILQPSSHRRVAKDVQSFQQLKKIMPVRKKKSDSI